MKNIKNYALLFMAIGSISLSSCSKEDDDCVAPAVSQNILGTWTAELSPGDVTFNSNGTYVDDDEALFGAEVNGVVLSVRTYVITGDTLTLNIASPDSSNTASSDFLISQNECNQIKLTSGFLGLTFTETLNRK